MSRAEITTNIAGPQHFWSFLGQNRSKFDQNLQGGMPLFFRVWIFREKNKQWPTPKHLMLTQPCGLAAHKVLPSKKPCTGMPGTYQKLGFTTDLARHGSKSRENGTIRRQIAFPETARPKAEHRRPKADLMRVDALGAFRRPGHRPAGGRRPT